MQNLKIVDQLHERQNLGTILLEQKTVIPELNTFIKEAQQN